MLGFLRRSSIGLNPLASKEGGQGQSALFSAAISIKRGNAALHDMRGRRGVEMKVKVRAIHKEKEKEKERKEGVTRLMFLKIGVS